MTELARVVVSIDGIDGSGKSTFAPRLVDALAAEGAPAVVVRVDDFRRPVDWAAVPVELDAYYDAYFDLGAAEACLRAFVAGEAAVTIPVFDSRSERLGGERTLALAGAAVLVLEGVFPLRLPTAAAGHVVYLDTSAPEARRRIIARDLRKGRTQAEIERRIDLRYAPAQHRYHAALRPRERAALVIDNEDPRAPRVVRRDLAHVPPVIRAALERLVPASVPRSR